MYLRATVKRTKRGESVRYLQLAHNERNERGVPVARVIHNFGREDQLDREALLRLVRSIQRFLGGEETLRAATPEGFRFVAAPEAGGPHVLGALWTELGIARAISRVAGRGRGRSGVERAIFAMVCQRCLEPASKLEATRWLGRDVVLDGIAAVSDDELYRAMDFLLACAERVQESVFFSLANLLNLEVDVIFFDTTSSYFEVDADGEDDDAGGGEAGADAGSLRRRGHSKDHRPDLPQVVVGLAVTREGIPVRVWVWPGNRNDQTLIEQVKRGLAGWRLGRAIYVVDSGFSGRDNLRHLRSGGGHYIAGVRLRSGMPETERASPARAATTSSATTCASRRSGSETATPPSATSSATTRPRPNATASAGRSGSSGSRRSSPAFTSSTSAPPRRPNGRRTCAASARYATTPPCRATSARARAAGSRSTGRRSPPRNASTASTCSPRPTSRSPPRTSRSATSNSRRPSAPSAT
jgi:hypothetical protein